MMHVETTKVEIVGETITYLYQLIDYETCYCLSVWVGNKNVSAYKFDNRDDAINYRNHLMDIGAS